MYDIDERDRVVELEDVPRPSVGAPLPVVVADELTVQLAYLESAPDDDDPIVLVRFERPHAWFHGPPNDEAFEGHPLASRGLGPYRVFRVDDSSWVRRLERMNAVHERHRPEAFAHLSHYIFAFHDSTFECVAQGFTAVHVEGPLTKVAHDMVAALD